ncbi:MAG: ABC transporter permease [Acidobacteria bacterium]|nr:ABC transporter permease [Acidobacteriota bacterium]
MWHNLGQLLRYRGLIQSLVARDLKARYRGSMLGFFWSFVNPLLLLTIYSFVFTYLLQNRAEGLQPYAVFMFTALLPWTWFSSSLTEATGSLISGGNLIKKVLFPAEVLPFVTILSNMVHFLLGLPILIGFMVYYHVTPDWPQLPWFLVIVSVQLLFTAALSLFLSALAVHFRDVRDLVSNLLTFWFFATPIIYSYKDFPNYKNYFDWNPFTHLAISYQEILFFDGGFGHWKWLLALGGGSVVLFLAAYWVFDRLRDSFSEAV